jgi:hypothetical protein
MLYVNAHGDANDVKGGKPQPEPNWRFATKIYDDRYVIEAAIPWGKISGGVRPPRVGVGVYRSRGLGAGGIEENSLWYPNGGVGLAVLEQQEGK